MSVMTIYQYTQRLRAFEYAKSLVKDKGIVNLGAVGDGASGLDKIFITPLSNDTKVSMNVDIQTGVANLLVFDLNNKLPFEHKQFDVTFASHVLEHLDNWQFSLNEFSRVADNVVLVLPNPLDIVTWVHPNHKHPFSFSEIQKIQRDYGNVKIFV